MGDAVAVGAVPPGVVVGPTPVDADVGAAPVDDGEAGAPDELVGDGVEVAAAAVVVAAGAPPWVNVAAVTMLLFIVRVIGLFMLVRP